jgi:hypothetical protein
MVVEIESIQLKEKSPVRLYTVANKIDIGGAKKENVANI